ncbi:hypothetical protein CC78DRAFT_565951 [Lojkania enalia]|uniref:Uncharacterized protein n=1 Tax=Lojkania enalia TaxID=147567 RepID=A0A9P4N611_9PLEO|nr:hypothetical protein CC78DRAFT_565951 [Didymosphaeria enalia]
MDSWRENHTFTVTHHENHDRRNEIQPCTDELKNEPKELDNDDDLVDDDEDRERLRIESCAKASCRVLCAAVYTKLPRELRDNIYARLNPDSRVNVPGKDKSWKLGSSLKRRKPFYCDAQYLGENVFKEFVENWYRTCEFQFKIENVSEPTWLPSFKTECSWLAGLLQKDLSWNTPIIPADIISRVRISFGPEDVRLGVGLGQGHLVAATKNLLNLKRGSHICLYMRWDFGDKRFWERAMTNSWRLSRIGEFAEMLLPITRLLDGAGYKTTVKCGDRRGPVFKHAELTTAAWVDKLEEIYPDAGNKA